MDLKISFYFLLFPNSQLIGKVVFHLELFPLAVSLQTTATFSKVLQFLFLEAAVIRQEIWAIN